MRTQKFKDWLDLKEMAERPQPGGDWGYSHSGTYKGYPTKNQWIKKGQSAVPAFTTDDELFDPHRPHSEYEKAAWNWKANQDIKKNENNRHWRYSLQEV